MPKILIAEDDHTMVSLLKTLLKMEGFDVVNVDVHTDVPTVVAREKPDALLMDVHLGEQNGTDIVTLIRKEQQFAHINIVMTSGLNMKDECLKSGANHFLLKPFMPDDLIKVLKN
ncbi:MAG TPA: response regulator [Anaerolineales bacterium]|nr:response regulator [Anaerolineales bacterium]